MSLHEPFRMVYEDYRRALILALRRDERTYMAVALDCQETLDGAWDRASRAMPPLTGLARVGFTRKRVHFFLHAVGRQAAWPAEAGEVQDDALALACTAGGHLE